MEPSYVPKDLAEYEERIFIGLSGRQLRWGIIALISGVGTYCISSLILHIPQDLAMWLTIGIAFCLFWMGWRQWQNVRPYTDKIKAVMRMKTLNQKVVYAKEEGVNETRVLKKTRQDKKINKLECYEGQRQKRKRR